MRNEMGRADETVQWASVKRSGRGQSKPLQLASPEGAARLGQERYSKHMMRRKQMEWKREHDDLLGKESLTEEGTSQGGGSDVVSERLQANRFGKGIWYPEEGNRDGRRGRRCGIASQTLGPGESPMRPLGTGKRSSWRRQSRWGRFSASDIDALETKEFHQLPPMEATLPVSPQDRMRSEKWRRWRREEAALPSGQRTALTRRGFLVAVP